MPTHPILDFMFRGDGSQTIDLSGNGIATAEAFGTTKLNQNINAQGIASAEVFGDAKLNLNIQPSGIISEEAFGIATLSIIQEEVRGGRRVYDFELEKRRRIEKQNQEIMLFITTFTKVVNG